jgi:hypothetical protein
MKLSHRFGSVLVGIALISVPAMGQSLSVNDDGSLGLVLNSGGATSAAPGSLTTMFASNNGFAGNMFDITPAVDLEITAIDINVNALGTLAEVDVWYRLGTSVGFEDSNAGWTLLGSYSGTSADQDNPTNIDMTGNGMTFVGGQVYGMYVDLTSYSTQSIRYTNGGPTTYSNSDLSLTTSVGKGAGFSGSTFSPREWNGTVYYDTLGGGGFTLAVDQFMAGAASTVDTSGSTPGDRVIVAYSLAGGGPTSTAHFGIVDLTHPIVLFSGINADANGETTQSHNIPPLAGGVPIWMQAMTLPLAGGVTLSNSLAEVIL